MHVNENRENENITESSKLTLDNDNTALGNVKSFRLKHPKNLIIGHYNLNSVRHKFNEMRLILDNGLCDILGISETKIDDSFPLSQFSVPNYRVYRQDRDNKGGGVMLYIKENIPHRILKDFTGCQERIDYITLEISTKRGKWALVYMYKPPSVSDTTLSSHMCGLFDQLISSHILLLFFGDMNKNLLLLDNSLNDLCDLY